MIEWWWLLVVALLFAAHGVWSRGASRAPGLWDALRGPDAALAELGRKWNAKPESVAEAARHPTSDRP